MPFQVEADLTDIELGARRGVSAGPSSREHAVHGRDIGNDTYLVHYLVYSDPMSEPVNIHDAKTHFSKLLERVALGEEIIIARAGKPIAKLSPLTPRKARMPGGAEGLEVPDSFFEPLPDDILEHFG